MRRASHQEMPATRTRFERELLGWNALLVTILLQLKDVKEGRIIEI